MYLDTCDCLAHIYRGHWLHQEGLLRLRITFHRGPASACCCLPVDLSQVVFLPDSVTYPLTRSPTRSPTPCYVPPLYLHLPYVYIVSFLHRSIYTRVLLLWPTFCGRHFRLLGDQGQPITNHRNVASIRQFNTCSEVVAICSCATATWFPPFRSCSEADIWTRARGLNLVFDIYLRSWPSRVVLTQPRSNLNKLRFQVPSFKEPWYPFHHR